MGSDPFFSSCLDQIVAVAARHGIPTIYEARDFVMAGGLSGGSVATDLFGPLGRPSPISALNLLLIAIALMMPRSQPGGRVYSALIALGLAKPSKTIDEIAA